MTRQQILNTIKTLAQSQGFYVRLLRDIDEYPAILDDLEAQNFKDPVDMVLYLEQ